MSTVLHFVPTAAPLVISPVLYLLHLCRDCDEASHTGAGCCPAALDGRGSPRGPEPCYYASATEAASSQALPGQQEEGADDPPYPRMSGERYHQDARSPEVLSGHCTDILLTICCTVNYSCHELLFHIPLRFLEEPSEAGSAGLLELPYRGGNRL